MRPITTTILLTVLLIFNGCTEEAIPNGTYVLIEQKAEKTDKKFLNFLNQVANIADKGMNLGNTVMITDGRFSSSSAVNVKNSIISKSEDSDWFYIEVPIAGTQQRVYIERIGDERLKFYVSSNKVLIYEREF